MIPKIKRNIVGKKEKKREKKIKNIETIQNLKEKDKFSKKKKDEIIAKARTI